ncbi:hypothetical protein V9L05_23620 (plasmid) [Bernardetia sp. Wsw4-3y2]|uniref:hypothetical protein n=1 Tax=Bernardetia sp. Wsw4-3y2 TaxID=3127471 RepID=UPI0030D55AA9
MEINAVIKEAVALSLFEIEKTIRQDLEKNISLYTNAYVIFKEQKFIRFALSFVKSEENVLFALDYYMPVLLWDIEREKTVILQKERNEKSKLDYKSALGGTMLENYVANKDNIVFGNTLIYPSNSIT